MKLSINKKYQDEKAAWGYQTIDVATKEEFERIVRRSDHCCAVLKDGHRIGSSFVSSDWLFMDIDGGMPIKDFLLHPDFNGKSLVIYTSRNHQKDKNGAGACDRYHVLLDVPTITNPDELAAKLKAMSDAYPWADVSCKDTVRLLFANKDAEVIWQIGDQYKIPEPKFIDDIPWDATAKTKTSTIIASKKPINGDKKSLVLDAVIKTSASGKLESYQDYINVGMAMKAEGFSFQDWWSVLLVGKPADSDTLAEAEYKWSSFDPKIITGGTLMHYCRQAVPELLVKGSMPPQPKINIGRMHDEKTGFSTDAPTTLEIQPGTERAKEIYEKITYLSKNGNDETRKLIDGWYLMLLEHDPELANCAKHDYTTGGPTISYSNTEILKTAIRRRIRAYGVPERAINDTIVNRVYDEVIYVNRHHNRVLAFTKDLQRNYAGEKLGPELLDEFISYLNFQDPGEHEPWDYEHSVKMYREIFHLFFLRMHLHVQGTAMVKDGGYYGLMTNDIVPVLGGSQEIGKTTLCQWLACNREDMYVDLGSGGKSSTFGTSDTVRQVRGRMIAELGEMKIMRDSANVEAVKSFISKTKYELDVKYVEHSEPLPSTVSYIGTSNPDEYLSDVTGNRRFFPIKLLSIDLAGLSKNTALACRLHAYYASLAESIKPDDRFSACMQSQELRDFIGAKRSEAMITYSDHGAIIEVVSHEWDEFCRDNLRRDGVHKIQNHEIEKLITDAGYRFMVTKNSITAAMESLGYSYQPAKINKTVQRAWIKKKA